MKQLYPHILSCLLLIVAVVPGRAVTLLDDTFADGTRNNQNLPIDSAWFFSTAADVTTTTAGMALSLPGSSFMGITYFGTNSSSPVSLGIGDILTASIKFTFNNVAPANTSTAFRLGLFDFADSSLSPKWVTADGFSTSSQGTGVQGYALFQNMGVIFNNASPMHIYKRTTVTDASLLGTTGDWTSLASGPDNTNNFPGFASGGQYMLQIAVQRADAVSLVINISWHNLASGASLATSVTDSAASTFNFDGISLRPSGAGTTATNIVFNEVRVDLVSPGAASGTDQWAGGVNNNWDTNTLNWTINGVAVAYTENDSVLFGDSAQSGTVDLVGATSHTPSGWTVTNNLLNYTFAGTSSIGGAVSLEKSGSASLTLAESGDSFTGGITVNSGAVILDEAASAISGGLIIANGAMAQIGNNDGNGGLPSGPVADNGALVFSQTITNLISTAISGSGMLTQNGSGTLDLAVANAYTGNTFVLQGTLALTGLGAIANSANVIVSNGTLDVSGAVGTPSLNNLCLTNAVISVGPATVNVSTLNLGGSSNTINVRSLPNFLFYPTNFVLIQSANGINGDNLVLGSMPAGNPPYTGSLSNSGNAVVLTVATVVPFLNIGVVASANPSTSGQAVTFTASVQTNSVTAGNATGTFVFNTVGLSFSTNTVNGGTATSAAISSLPIGIDPISVVYSGGNYPLSSYFFYQTVNPPPGTNAAQDNLPIYTDNMVNGFYYSSSAVNLENISPVHSGSYSISMIDDGDQEFWVENQQFNTTPYSSFSFWANGGSTGGQYLQIVGLLDGIAQPAYVLETPLAANTWQHIVVPLSSLGVSNQPNCTGFGILGATGFGQPIFYLDDIELTAAPAPSVGHLGVNAGQVLQTVDARQFGLNTATWDHSLGAAQTLPMLQAAGTLALRWPGGSTSDTYNWATDPSGNATFQSLAKNLGAQVFTTVNYGTGTPGEAAAWVLAANKTNNCGFKYWEVGNECYGSWETDSNVVPHDPYTYATQAVAYIQQMKAAYPGVPIKVGVVAVPGENSFINNEDHSAYNPVTQTTHYGWTPVMLSEMKSLGVLPDFLIYHFYWQYTSPSGWTYYSESPDSDPLLLQVPGNPSPLNWSDWASAAASLREQLNDYVGPASSNIELCVTENNSDSGAMGRESTSIVNALYLADSASQLMKTEFRSYLFWDLHNGPSTNGDMDPTIYGWRTNGDFGIMNASDSPYPTYYAEKLLQYFARPGDSVLNGTSDNLLLSAYAVRRTNGALTMLVINKAMTMTLNAQIGLTNFVPWTTATTLSYGIPQDQAASANAAAYLQDLATNNVSGLSANFNYSFPPLSMTLFTLAPAPATLSGPKLVGGQLQMLMLGQSSTPYVIQSSSNLVTWTSISTNMLVGSTLSVTNPIPAGAPDQFYRAIWQP